MNARKLLVALAAALVVLFGWAAPASAYAGCNGEAGPSCHNLDPASTVKAGTSTLCTADAVTERPVGTGTSPHIDIRYSANCRAAWLRVQYVPAGVGLHLTVTWANPHDGSHGMVDVLDDSVSYGNVLNYTFMVNAPNGSTNYDGSCDEIDTVTATADYAGLHTSFATPRDNLGHFTC